MAVVTSAASEDPKQRQKALDFFKAEFELDYKIAKLGEQVLENAGKGGNKQFVAFMDGITSECHSISVVGNKASKLASCNPFGSTTSFFRRL